MSAQLHDINTISKKEIPVVDELREEDILHAFNEGDKSAFEKIYKTYFPNVYYFAKRFVGEEDAEDLTAEAFYKLWKREKNFRKLSSIKIYLQVIVRNDCFTFLETRRNITSKEREFAYLAGQTSIYEDHPDEIMAGSLKLVHCAIEKLPKQMKKVFKMAYIGSIKNKDIAMQLGISENTVRVHKTKALAILRIAVKAGCWMLALLFSYC